MSKLPLFRVETQSGIFEYFEASTEEEAREKFELFQNDEAGKNFKGEKIYGISRVYTRMFEVSEDLQGGGFGKGRIQNAEQWLDDARGWAWQDDNEDLQKELRKLANEPDEAIIETIADVWQLEFKEVMPWKTH